MKRHLVLALGAIPMLFVAAPVDAQVTSEVTIVEAQEIGEIGEVAGDGRWVAHYADDTGVLLWDATTEASIVVDADGFGPSISDDGRWVAYSKFVGGQFDVFLWDRLDQSSTRLSNTPALSLHSSISDDGGVVVWRDDGATLSVWRRATNAVETRALNFGLPLVSGNGEFVFYRDGAASAVRWQLSNGATVSVPQSFEAVSDDGNTVAYIVGDPGFTAGIGVGVHTVVGGGDAELAHARNEFGVGPTAVELSGDGSTVTFFTREAIDPAESYGSFDTYRWTPSTDAREQLTEHRILSLTDDGSAAVAHVTPIGSSDSSYALLALGAAPAPTTVLVGDLAEPQLADQMTRIYQAFLLRAPDAGGLDFWMRRRADGWSLAQIADNFEQSDEFVARYGQLTDAEFVDLVYANVLDRSPDAGGRAHWIGQLEAGMSRGTLMVGFSESAENVGTTGTTAASPALAHQIWRLYSAYLLRDADQGGFDFWYELASTGTSLAAISDSFAASAEFVDRYGQLTDAGFVDLVYANVLDRIPDAGGRAHWIGQLEGGMSRGALMLAFSESPEFILKTNTLPA